MGQILDDIDFQSQFSGRPESVDPIIHNNSVVGWFRHRKDLKKFIITFRGSNSQEELMECFDSQMTPCRPYLDLNGKMYNGQLDQFEETTNGLVTKLINNGYLDEDILFAGYSIGGPKAIRFASNIALKLKGLSVENPKIQVVTFASFAVFDQEAAGDLKQKLPGINIINYSAAGDTIARFITNKNNTVHVGDSIDFEATEEARTYKNRVQTKAYTLMPDKLKQTLSNPFVQNLSTQISQADSHSAVLLQELAQLALGYAENNMKAKEFDKLKQNPLISIATNAQNLPEFAKMITIESWEAHAFLTYKEFMDNQTHS